jgi:hypothetical protein
MPGFDQNGPEGKGPMTGRRMGRCTNYGANPDKQAPSTLKDEGAVNQPEDIRTNVKGAGLGRGRCGRGPGRGMRNRFRGGC